MSDHKPGGSSWRDGERRGGVRRSRLVWVEAALMGVSVLLLVAVVFRYLKAREAGLYSGTTITIPHETVGGGGAGTFPGSPGVTHPPADTPHPASTPTPTVTVTEFVQVPPKGGAPELMAAIAAVVSAEFGGATFFAGVRREERKRALRDRPGPPARES
ncbi:hypothetical protein [Streptomyces chattanoogensis]|uniref:Uncharacterized protein n=1 Tax=Streptomyces chattanoogensis TaxID=66876 RepID=A0A0N0H4I6_9ACTN|nr:hypothetical protein [Streptomyces chattanoogensis]KPC67162.1 hypothetical protein ADL29_03150 [Streptomyces chattanoogensis]